MLAVLSSLPISVLRILYIEANKFYYSFNRSTIVLISLYDAALFKRVFNMLFDLTSILKLITKVILSKLLS